MFRPRSVDSTPAVASAALLTAVCLLPVLLIPYVVGAAAASAALTPWQLGILPAAILTGVIAVMFSAVFWVRRSRWSTVVAGGLCIASLGYAVAAHTQHLVPLMTCLLTAGCGAGIAYAPAVCALSDTTHPDRNFGYSFFLQIVVSGIAGLLATALGLGAELRGVLGLVSVFFLAALLLVPFLPSTGRKQDSESKVPGARPSGRVWVGLIGVLLLTAGPTAIWAFYERIGAAAGFSPTSVGTAIGVGLLMGAPGALLSSLAGDRFGRIAPLTLSTLLMVGTFASVVATHNLTVYFLSGLAFQFLLNFGLAFQLGAVSVADVAGRMIVLAPTLQGLGAIAGPAVAGVLVSRGYAYVAALAGLLTLIGVTLVVGLCRANPNSCP